MDPRHRRHRAVEQRLDDADRFGEIGTERRAEHGGGIDHGKLEAIALARDEIPGGALGQRLGFRIGLHVGAIEIGPHRLVERRRLRRMA
ncbi:hypothetical protein chiPu_0030357, partial [Chiloscyllium punctatum]|nr:hypothetical protein [Chiloscyllium punctatum]